MMHRHRLSTVQTVCMVSRVRAMGSKHRAERLHQEANPKSEPETKCAAMNFAQEYDAYPSCTATQRCCSTN